MGDGRRVKELHDTFQLNAVYTAGPLWVCWEAVVNTIDPDSALPAPEWEKPSEWKLLKQTFLTQPGDQGRPPRGSDECEPRVNSR